MDWAGIIGSVPLALGAMLLVIGGVGINRFPHFYSRLHAAGVVDTLAAGLVLLGLAPFFGLTLGTLKLALILVFLLFTSPTACHALARAAHTSGMREPPLPGETPSSPS
jgi:multicomponent Na+:H+ antiporter subunit G